MDTKRPRPTTPGDAPRDPARREVLGDLASVTLAALVAAVLPRVRQAHAGGFGDVPLETWRRWTAAGRQALAAGIDRWTQNAMLTGGMVNASTVFLPPGSLSGPSFEAEMAGAMRAADAPAQVAAAFAGVAWEAWDTWAMSYHQTITKALPAFAAVPAPETPETALRMRALRAGSAPGKIGLTVEVLPVALTQLLGPPANEPNAQTAIGEFAAAYQAGFAKWFRRATLVNVIGKGRVPAFAPPYVPVGPVVAGDVFGTNVLVAPAFLA